MLVDAKRRRRIYRPYPSQHKTYVLCLQIFLPNICECYWKYVLILNIKYFVIIMCQYHRASLNNNFEIFYDVFVL